MICVPGPATAGLKIPVGDTPGPVKTNVPGTAPVSLACVIWYGAASRQVGGSGLNKTLGAAFTTIVFILSFTQVAPEYAR